MKRLLWLLPLLFVAVTSAAPNIPPQGTAALSSFLKDATDRGDVPGVVVAVVNKDGVVYHEAFGREPHAHKHADDEGHDLQHGVDDQTGHLGRHHDARGRRQTEAGRRSGEVLAEVQGSRRHQQVQRGRRHLRDAPGEAADHHPASVDAHIRHRLRVREPDADEDHGEDRQDRAGSSAAVRPGRKLGVRRQHACPRQRRRGHFGAEARRVPRVAHPGPARHARHELPGAGREVSARRRGERARRRREVRGAADAGHAARAELPATAACTARPATTDCSCACSSTAASWATRAS